MLCVRLSLVAVNLAYGQGQGQLLMPSWIMGIDVVLMSSLVATLAASAGALISLRAATVRQAQQTSSAAFLLLFMPLMFVPSLPQQWHARLFE